MAMGQGEQDAANLGRGSQTTKATHSALPQSLHAERPLATPKFAPAAMGQADKDVARNGIPLVKVQQKRSAPAPATDQAGSTLSKGLATGAHDKLGLPAPSTPLELLPPLKPRVAPSEVSDATAKALSQTRAQPRQSRQPTGPIPHSNSWQEKQPWQSHQPEGHASYSSTWHEKQPWQLHQPNASASQSNTWHENGSYASQGWKQSWQETRYGNSTKGWYSAESRYSSNTSARDNSWQSEKWNDTQTWHTKKDSDWEDYDSSQWRWKNSGEKDWDTSGWDQQQRHQRHDPWQHSQNSWDKDRHSQPSAAAAESATNSWERRGPPQTSEAPKESSASSSEKRLCEPDTAEADREKKDKKDKKEKKEKKDQDAKHKRESSPTTNDSKRFKSGSLSAPSLSGELRAKTIGFPPTISGFYKFMREREEIRIKRARGCPWPWTEDKLLQCIRVANVKREHDRTGLLVQRLLGQQAAAWQAAQADVEQKIQVARSWIFNVALWRRFGTVEFISKLGFKPLPKSPEALQALTEEVLGVALAAWSEGSHACTDAYGPAKNCNAIEYAAWLQKGVDKLSARRQNLISELKAAEEKGMPERDKQKLRSGLASRPGEKYLSNAYKQLLVDSHRPVRALWEQSAEVASVIVNNSAERSWRRPAEAMREVKGYSSGQGLHAAELIRDLLSTALLSGCADMDQWVPVSSAARQCICRLVSKEGHAEELSQEEALQALLEIFGQRSVRWPGSILSEPSVELRLPDVQNQLGEFERYLRARAGKPERAAFFPRLGK